MKKIPPAWLFLPLILLVSCRKSGSAVSSPVTLGVTPWPAAYTAEAVQQAYGFIASDCDFVTHHMDDGIPYEEAFRGLPMPASLEADIQFRRANTPAGKPVFLSVSALDLSRVQRAAYWKNDPDADTVTRQFWEGLPFDHPAVIKAYLGYLHYLIDQFHPSWINFGVESNAEGWVDSSFQQYKRFCAAVYASLKQEHPGTPLMLSLMVSESGSGYRRAAELMACTDWVALSAYPYTSVSSSANGNTDPDLFPAGYFEHWLDLAPNKPWCFAETGYIAEPLQVPEFNLFKDGRPEWQNRYLQKLGKLMHSRNGRFISWFCYADYDALIPELQAMGVYQPLFLFWRDIGLFDGQQRPRPALETWRSLRAGK